jgi:hypothetical protein
MRVNGAMGIKNGMLKGIGYFKGYESPFIEDVIKLNKEAKAERPPIFSFKKYLNATTLEVKDNDIALINFIEKHEDYGRKFERYSEVLESERALGKFAKVEKALSIVNESDEYRIKALGLCIIGFDTYGREASTIIRQLKELAFESPQKVIDEYENPHFDNKLLVSLAFCSNIIEVNDSSTAIQWVVGKGRILGIATGEDTVVKMTEFIASQTPESSAVLQEMGKRLDTLITRKAFKRKEEDKIKTMQERINELEAKLAGKDIMSIVVEKDPDNYHVMSLEDASALYLEEFKTPVPFRFKKDINWILGKIKGKAPSEKVAETEDVED